MNHHFSIELYCIVFTCIAVPVLTLVTAVRRDSIMASVRKRRKRCDLKYKLDAVESTEMNSSEKTAF